MKNIAVYPGTFDPITYGHIDLVQRALKLFDRVIVAVADNEFKQPLFLSQERIVMARAVLADFDQVEVMGFEGLLTQFAAKHQVTIMLRGLRVVSDFDYEFQMASVNRLLMPELETVFLTPAEKYTYVSSSVVREIARGRGDVSKFVPPIIQEALRQKIK